MKITAQKTNPLLELLSRKLCFRPNQKKKTKKEEDQGLSPKPADQGSVVMRGDDGDNDQRRSQEQEASKVSSSNSMIINEKELITGEEERAALSSGSNETVGTRKKFCKKGLNNRSNSVWDYFEKEKRDPLYDLWSLHFERCARNTRSSSTNGCLLGGQMRYSCCC